MKDSLLTQPKPSGHGGGPSIPDYSKLVDFTPVEEKFLSSIVMHNYYESVTLLGGNAQETLALFQSKHKPNLALVFIFCKKLYLELKEMDIDNIAFLTLRPSPEFMYNKWSNRIVGYERQIEEFATHMQYITDNCGVKIKSISVEKGTNKSQQQILHYHIIITGKLKYIEKAKKYLINHHTNLHKVYGYQKALKQTVADARTIFKGILYYNGLKVNEIQVVMPDGRIVTKLLDPKQKPDVYKHMIDEKLFYINK